MTTSTPPTLNISQEFFQTTSLFEGLASFSDKLREFFQDKDDTANLVGANRVPSPRGLSRQLKKASYADIRNTTVQVPSGLSVPYLEYLAALDGAVTLTEGLMDDVLGPFARWLAIGLSDPDTLNSMGSGRRIQDFKPHNIDGALITLGECFETGKTQYEQKFGQVFGRNGDVEAVFKQASDLNSRYVKTDRKAVIAKVNEISDHLDRLIARIEEEEENYKVSTVTRDLVAKMSYTLAQEVEFYGSVGYQLMALTVALQETETRLKKVL